MFYGRFADEGDSPVDNTNIWNVEEYKRLSPGLHPLTTGSVLQIRFCQSLLIYYYAGNYFVVFYKKKKLKVF